MADEMNLPRDPRDPRVNQAPAPVVPNVPTVGPSPDPRVPHPVTGLLPERAPEVIVTRQTPEQLQGLHAQLEEGVLARVHGRITEITGHSNRLVEEFEALRNKVASLESRVNQVTPDVSPDRLSMLQTQFDALLARVDAQQARIDLTGPVVGGLSGSANPSLITRQVSGVVSQVVVPGVPTPVGTTQGQIDAERQVRQRAAAADLDRQHAAQAEANRRAKENPQATPQPHQPNQPPKPSTPGNAP